MDMALQPPATLGSRIRFRHLNCFLEVAGRSSFVGAARALGVTQPAVSKTIGELEATLRVQLFERSRAGVRLTAEGEAFRRHAGPAVSELRRAIASVDPSDRQSLATVSVGALPTVAGQVVPAAVLAARGNGLRARIRVAVGPAVYLLAELRAGQLDFVVGRMAEAAEMAGLQFERLYSERVVFVVRTGHPLALAGSGTLASIVEFPVVLPPAGSAIRPEVDRALIANGIGELRDVVESASPVFSISLLKSSDAIWIISRSVVAAEIGEGGLVELPFEAGIASGPVGLTTRPEGLPSVAADVLVAEIRSAVPHPETARPDRATPARAGGQ